MKRTDSFKALVIGFALCAFSGCDTPTNSASQATTVPNTTASDAIPSADTSKNTDTEAERSADENDLTVKRLTVALKDDFMRGFDVSAVDYDEEINGTTWKDIDGTQKDFFQILSDHGVNTARIRVWVDPDNAGAVTNDTEFSESWKSGNNTTARAVSMAKRAKAAGLSVMLDFHYSDYWTDPGKQVIPHAWQSISTASAMAEKIASYTKEVLQAMKDGDVTPEYVQVGNEIDNGILLHTYYDSDKDKKTAASSSISGAYSSANFAAYISAGCSAVREFDAGIKIVLHVTNGSASGVIAKLSDAHVDYDIIGLSYYAWEPSHGTISDLKETVSSLVSTYGKEVVITESSMYYDYGEYEENYYDLSIAARHLVDSDTDAVFQDLATETVTYNNADTLIVKGSLHNQINTFRHIIEASVASGANGICAWGGERRAEWKYAFFDRGGTALESLNIFAIEGN